MQTCLSASVPKKNAGLAPGLRNRAPWSGKPRGRPITFGITAVGRTTTLPGLGHPSITRARPTHHSSTMAKNDAPTEPWPARYRAPPPRRRRRPKLLARNVTMRSSRWRGCLLLRLKLSLQRSVQNQGARAAAPAGHRPWPCPALPGCLLDPLEYTSHKARARPGAAQRQAACCRRLQSPAAAVHPAQPDDDQSSGDTSSPHQSTPSFSNSFLSSRR